MIPQNSDFSGAEIPGIEKTAFHLSDSVPFTAIGKQPLYSGMRALIIDDEPNIRKALSLGLETMGLISASAANSREALDILRSQSIDIAFLDLRLGTENGLDVIQPLLDENPRLSIIVLTAHASYASAVDAIKLGAFDYVPKPITPDVMRQILVKVEKNRHLRQRVEDLEEQVASAADAYDFSDDDPAMAQVLSMLNKVAPTTASVLLLGENGTGKSVLASEVHRRSSRSKEAFITVSCPSLSQELLESELFGHIKGAFTGAVSDKTGKVSVANGGTLFLDEIGELPPALQPKLLRLLQEKEYERVGDHRTKKADVRVIAATNRDLEEMVRKGDFREDLYYRLNVISMRIPALRERKASLLRIANNQLRFLAKSMGRDVHGFTDEALMALESYHWPGNLREMRNALERAVILCDGNLIRVDDLPVPVNKNSGTSVHVGSLVSIEELEREHIRYVLNRCNNLDETAKVLGIDAATLYRKRKKFGLN